MSDVQAYDLLSTGNLVEGFDQEQVVKSFAGLFNCDENKALAFATTEKVIRKEIDKATGESYSETLKQIGLDVQLVARTPPAEEPEAANGGLSLAPVELSVTDDSAEAIDDGMIRTSHMKAEGSAPAGTPPPQANGGVQAPSTGAGSATSAPSRAASDTSRAPIKKESSNVSAGAIIGPILGAVAGALIWAMILKGIEYELGLVAIAVGGLVGFGASMTGFKGPAPAVVCALLVAVSIFGGKYLGYTWWMEDFNDYDAFVDEEIISDVSEWGDIYRSESKTLSRMDQTDENLKQFMVNNDYSYDETPSAEELEEFKNLSVARIMAFDTYTADNPGPTYRKLHAWWLNASDSSSVMESIKASFGMLDVLFLFIGMSGAFRLASEED